MTEADITNIAKAVAATRPEPASKSFPGGMGGIVATVFGIVMLLGGIGTIVGGAILAILGFLGSHFFSEFTALRESVSNLESDFRAQGQTMTAIALQVEKFEDRTQDRYTATQAVADFENHADQFHREVADARADLLREIADNRRLSEDIQRELDRRSNFKEEADLIHNEHTNAILRLNENLERLERLKWDTAPTSR